MKLEAVTAEIRPRSDWEAVDLGFAMVRRDFWRCLSVWWLAVLPVVLAGGFLLWDRPLLFLLLFWWAKPAASRMVLFEISRRLFGEAPPWRAVWRELPRAWCRRFFYRFLWARFSPWMLVTLAVEDLEGLRGKAYRQRARQVARRGEGTVTWIYLSADFAAVWFGLAIFGLAAMLLPAGQEAPWRTALETWQVSDPWAIPLLFARTAAVCLMLAISLSDCFITGAGFGIYVNNRTWIEGWDIELAFKRLSQRLTKVAAVVLAAGCFVVAGEASAQSEASPDEVIAEVKSHPEFIVHTETVRVPAETGADWSLPTSLMQAIGTAIGWLAAAAAVGFLGWMIWRHRHLFVVRGGGAHERPPPPAVRVVMGMEVTPESLPADVPGAALALWRQGRRQEALGLLYRGTISQVMAAARVEIRESDTEGDCLGRVEAAGTAAHPGYFRELTEAWIGMAYAGVAPSDPAVEKLCMQWPFQEGRPA